MDIFNGDKYSIELKSKIYENFSKPKNLEEYFIIIGLEPKICSNKNLFTSTVSLENNSSLNFKPKILSKFPPFRKSYINIDDSIIDLCFPEGCNLLKFNRKPEPTFHHFILDNSFYSIEYPLKYVSCLKIYESLYNYYNLDCELDKDKEKVMGSENTEINTEIKNYYFPKFLCLVSTQNFFQEQEGILTQIYDYYLDKNIKIPLEKKILTILYKIPMPPKGLLKIEFKMAENFKKIILKRQKMNKLLAIKDELGLIFSKFDIKTVLEIFRYTLFETKILIFGSQVNEISNFIYGLISLLFPFRYLFQISSSLPNNSFNVLESLSPYIFGINKIFKNNFFKKNKIDISELDILVIDLDNVCIKFYGNKIIPEIPNSLLKPLQDELFEANQNKLNLFNENKYKFTRRLFYHFFVNAMVNYDLYIKTDYFKNKITNTGIKNLFKINEFINSHSSNERDFYEYLISTQMFCDFIYRKMIPKDSNEKLETLFFDESISKKLNKKFFSRKKSCIFLNSKEYEYNYIYEVPQPKKLSPQEKEIFLDGNIKKKLLKLGQKINYQFNKETKKEEISFEYYLFPVLSNLYYKCNFNDDCFTMPELPVLSDIDRINADILSKTLIKSTNNNFNNKEEQEMKNYIYLSYLELWSYNYWYFDSCEKKQKFNEMMDILSKISFYDIELFDSIFKSLNKFKDKDKILKLYDFIINHNIPPSSYICKNINSYLYNIIKNEDSESNPSDLNNKNHKRTFHSKKDGECLGDKIRFNNKQNCPECGQEIDITEICLNFKNMRKDFFWVKCTSCDKYIIPKLGINLGTEIISKDKNDDLYNDYYSSSYTRFILYSPYDLKTKIREIKNKNEFNIFHIETFKEEYPNLFWSCIWYFNLYNINYDIILPYEFNINQEINNYEKNISLSIISKVNINQSYNNTNINNSNKKYKKRKKKNLLYKDLIIHSTISITFISDYEKEKSNSYNNRISDDNICRKSTNTCSNVSTIFSSEKIHFRSSINNIMWPKQKNKFNSCTNFPRVRLNTLTESSLQSPILKSRKLFDFRSSYNAITSIKGNEEYLVFPFHKYSINEEIEEVNFDNNIKTFSYQEKNNIINISEEKNQKNEALSVSNNENKRYKSSKYNKYNKINNKIIT